MYRRFYRGVSAPSGISRFCRIFIDIAFSDRYTSTALRSLWGFPAAGAHTPDVAPRGQPDAAKASSARMADGLASACENVCGSMAHL